MKKRRKAQAAATGRRAAPADLDPAFAPVVAAFARDRRVGLGKMFSSESVLNVDGRIFAMFVKGQFVAKLPKGRVVDDGAEGERVRRGLVAGVFRLWTETGRAPTPAEFAARMQLSQADADRLLDQLQACGEAVGSGILRVPESELIAVAWPFANVP